MVGTSSVAFPRRRADGVCYRKTSEFETHCCDDGYSDLTSAIIPLQGSCPLPLPLQIIDLWLLNTNIFGDSQSVRPFSLCLMSGRSFLHYVTTCCYPLVGSSFSSASTALTTFWKHFLYPTITIHDHLSSATSKSDMLLLTWYYKRIYITNTQAPPGAATALAISSREASFPSNQPKFSITSALALCEILRNGKEEKCPCGTPGYTEIFVGTPFCLSTLS